MHFYDITTHLKTLVLSISFIALMPSSAFGIPLSMTATTDGFVRDGSPPAGAIKDGLPDRIFNNGIVQVLDVPQFEDRGIMEFDLSFAPSVFSVVELALNTWSSEGPYPFTIDVLTYSGDGNLALGDFELGSYHTSFQFSGELTTTLDVTALVQGFLATGQNYLGFNFQFSEPSSISLNGPFVAWNSNELTATSNPFQSILRFDNGPQIEQGPTILVPDTGSTIVFTIFVLFVSTVLQCRNCSNRLLY